MNTLKYKIIKSTEQYRQYCNALETLVVSPAKSAEANDEIELLSFLIEKWDAENSCYKEADPVEVIQLLMKEHSLKSKDLVQLLGVSKGLISDILNYKKGLSKDIIRLLSQQFKVSQEAFNRPYKLSGTIKSHLSDARVMNTNKKVELA